MTLDGSQDVVANVDALTPVEVEPLLQLLNVARTLDLDIQLDVLGQARTREVARPDQSLRAHDLEFGVCDVCLGMKLCLVVDPALDLPRSQRIDDPGHAV